jgi:hypothetical protein
MEFINFLKILRLRVPLPAIMIELVEKDLVKPGPAIGAELIAGEGFPCLHVRLLNKIVGIGLVQRQARGGPVNIVYMLHRLCFENLGGDLGHVSSPDLALIAEITTHTRWSGEVENPYKDFFSSAEWSDRWDQLLRVGRV